MAPPPPDSPVRTIPIDDDGVELLPPERPRRRVPPFSVAVVLIGIIGMLLAYATIRSGDSTPAAFDDSIASTEARPLPIARSTDDNQLLLVVTSAVDGWKIVWDPQSGNANTPTFGVVAPRSSMNLRGPQQDVSGTYRSNQDCEGPCGIDIIATDNARVVIDRVPGDAAAWHATRPASLAWSRTTPDGVVVAIGSVGEAGRTLQQDIDSVTLTRGDVVRWYDIHGVVTMGADIVAFDQSGRVRWESDGQLVDITEATATIVDDDSAWRIVDRVTGATIAAGSESANYVTIDAAVAEPMLSTRTKSNWAYQFRLVPASPQPGTIRLPLSHGGGSELRITRDASGTVFTLGFITTGESAP